MLTLLAFLLSAAPAARAPEAAPARRPHTDSAECTAVEIDSRRERPRSAGRAAGPRFSASRSLDLRFRTTLRTDRHESHSLEFRVRAPGGFLYQSIAVLVEGAAAGGKRPAHPAPQKPRALAATLPVAGTLIANHSLYGRWSVEPWLDGVPCAAVRAFVLGP